MKHRCTDVISELRPLLTARISELTRESVDLPKLINPFRKRFKERGRG